MKGVDGRQMAVRVNCLDGVDPQELIAAPGCRSGARPFDQGAQEFS